MKSWLIVGLVILALVVIGAVVYFNSSSNPYNITNNNSLQTVNIQITGFAFSPATLAVHVGDTITWTNIDSASHTVTSDKGTELGSQTLSRDGTYSHTFTTAGVFDYHCSFHSGMKGKIIVGLLD
ncbi:MAG: cupredoxin family copper-binding protein [Nanoarchaeota archaeon]